MICQPCRDAADQHAPANQHCTSTGGPGAPCDCQHRTDRYRPAPLPGLVAVAAFYDQLARASDAHAATIEAAIARVEAEYGPDDTIHIPRTDTTKD